MASSKKTTTHTTESAGAEFEYKVWKEEYWDPLTEEDIGESVMLASESSRTTVYLRAIHEEGEDMWPHGGYEVQIAGEKFRRHCFPQEVKPRK